MMRLADFIEVNIETILSEWESFARTLLPASDGLDVAALRDHAALILQTVADDLKKNQSHSEQISKSRGEVIRTSNNAETAAETHGMLRATGGFTLRQLVAEYRALRATVLRLWAEAYSQGPDTLGDMTRFNEAIDQAITESVEFFTTETERWRNVFLGVLGHDLRGPLSAVLLTSRVINKMSGGTPVSAFAERLIRGGERMRQLLDDLLDYNRTSLDLGIHLNKVSIDLAQACEEEVDLQRIALPAASIEFTVEGSTQGTFDGSRLKQVLGNLIGNAAKYGDQGAPIGVRLEGKDNEVVLSVSNSGPPIVESDKQLLFEPLRRGAKGNNETERTSLGLGLFIVRQVVQSHGGTVSLTSGDGQTVFTVMLPKTASSTSA